jgi:hypothetical protein
MSLIDVVLEVHRQLDDHDVVHAFGGALALAYVIEPRGTIDADVNVFSGGPSGGTALAALERIGFASEGDAAIRPPVAGIRLRRAGDPVPVDVFPPIDETRYATIEGRCERHPFGRPGAEQELPFLSAEDLALFKLSFGRDKDWVDLRRMAEARPGLDVDYIEDQLIGLRGPSMHPRIARLRVLLRG